MSATRALALILAGVLVAGCSTVPTMEPYAVEIHDKAQLDLDTRLCRGYALGYHRSLSASRIGSKAVSGAAQNLAGAAIQPYVPILGAAGQGGSEALEELGLTDVAQQRVFIRCLQAKTDHDGSALTLEPMP